MFRFEDPIYLYALALIPLLLVLRFLLIRQQKRRFTHPVDIFNDDVEKFAKKNPTKKPDNNFEIPTLPNDPNFPDENFKIFQDEVKPAEFREKFPQPKINPENIFYIFRTETDPNWHEKLIEINDFIKHREFYIDIEPYFYDAEGKMSNTFAIDGMHPDIRGKMLIGEIINLNRHLFKD